MPYQSAPDPYCYRSTSILKNIPDLRGQEELDEFEARMSALRGEEEFPAGRFSPTHYRAIHRHLFQDVYTWAGKYRTIRLSKGTSMFCYPEHINDQMKNLFANLKAQNYLRGLMPTEFARVAASFVSTLNAIHPFREGNGRTQLTFLELLARHAQHELNTGRLNPQDYLAASIAAFNGDDEPLAAVINKLV